MNPVHVQGGGELAADVQQGLQPLVGLAQPLGQIGQIQIAFLEDDAGGLGGQHGQRLAVTRAERLTTGGPHQPQHAEDTFAAVQRHGEQRSRLVALGQCVVEQNGLPGQHLGRRHLDERLHLLGVGTLQHRVELLHPLPGEYQEARRGIEVGYRLIHQAASHLVHVGRRGEDGSQGVQEIQFLVGGQQLPGQAPVRLLQTLEFVLGHLVSASVATRAAGQSSRISCILWRSFRGLNGLVRYSLAPACSPWTRSTS